MIFEIKFESGFKGKSNGKVSKIYKNLGDEISPGDILFDIEADKANITIESQYQGVIKNIGVKEGDIVKDSDILATIEGHLVEETSKDSIPFDYMSSLLKPKERNLICDIAILGGGPGGYVAAIKAAKMGAKKPKTLLLQQGQNLLY